MQSATERTGDRACQPIRYALISFTPPVRLSWFFNFWIFPCSPGRGMAEATADPNPTPIITITCGIWIQFISRGPWRNLVQFPIHSTQQAGPESRQWCVESHGLTRGVILGIYCYGNISIEELFNPCYIQITLIMGCPKWGYPDWRPIGGSKKAMVYLARDKSKSIQPLWLGISWVPGKLVE